MANAKVMISARHLVVVVLMTATMAPAQASHGVLARVSVAVDGAGSDGFNQFGVLSGDGKTVAFLSNSTNLVEDDTNDRLDVFVRDLTSGTTTRVSVSSSGEQSNHDSWDPAVSADGRYIAFMSYANNLVSDDTNQASDVFVHDRQAHETIRASIAQGGEESIVGGEHPRISDDGRRVVFTSFSFNLVPHDRNFGDDVFIRELDAQTTDLVSLDSEGRQYDEVETFFTGASMSADGDVVAFIVEGEGSNDSCSYCSWLVVRHTSGMRVQTFDIGDGLISDLSLSPDGRKATYQDGNDFVVIDLESGDPQTLTYPAYHDPFVTDLNYPVLGSFTADSDRVVLATADPLVLEDTNHFADVYLYDFNAQTIRRLSMSPGGDQGDFFSTGGSISRHGDRVVFDSYSTNFEPGILGYNVWSLELQATSRSCPETGEEGPVSGRVRDRGPWAGPGYAPLHEINCEVIVPRGL